MAWENAQICDECWVDWCWEHREGDRQPHRLVPAERECTRCPMCKRWNQSGIYIRVETVELPK